MVEEHDTSIQMVSEGNIFQTLMQDFEWLKEKGYSLPVSFTYTVENNMDAIVDAAVCFADSFWCALREISRCRRDVNG
jgi:hypothetical protein